MCNIVGQNVTDALKKLSDSSAKKAILRMRAFYKTVIKYLQQMLPFDNISTEIPLMFKSQGAKRTIFNAIIVWL